MSSMSREGAGPEEREVQRLKRSTAFIAVTSRTSESVNRKSDEGVSLTQYMRLPVTQYVCVKIPLSATLERVRGNEFLLAVPDVRFFNIVVSPRVTAFVSQTNTNVVIESTKVVLKGSPFVESLNGCYDISVKTKFSWLDKGSEGGSRITSSSDIKVGVNPPPPFKYFPRKVLEATGNLAMKLALDQIEGAFLQALGRDYEKWAVSADYRMARAGSDTCVMEDTCEV